ncbi:MAG: hypothetical protein WA637_04895, partial [Terriglobales bacterium]
PICPAEQSCAGFCLAAILSQSLKTCRAALDRADEDICPYALRFRACAKPAKFFYLSCSKAVILILLSDSLTTTDLS